MSYKSELIRKLFSDRLKKDELKDLSEIDMIERKMKVQWEEQNPIAENSERVDPEIGDYPFTTRAAAEPPMAAT